jgi:hypothetical protein
MRSWLLALALLLALSGSARAAGETREQTITPIPPREQSVTPVNPNGEQRVEALGTGDGTQQVSEGTRSSAGRAANNVAKVFVGITAAVVSIGATLAALFFI